MSKKRYYEVWFSEEPHYMERVSEKTLRMFIKQKYKIKRYCLRPSIRWPFCVLVVDSYSKVCYKESNRYGELR